MRGGGRGRGRAPQGPRPTARDDEGNPIEAKLAEGPPPTYPEREPLPLFTERVQEACEPLSRSLRSINAGFQSSAFHLGDLADRERRDASQKALASVVTLDGMYFPRELYTEQQKSKGVTKEAQAAYWAAHTQHTRDLASEDPMAGRLEELARREDLGGTPGTAQMAMGEIEEDEVIDDEELVEEDEDPYQNFDDDEEYDDDDDDGGNDAVY